MCRCRRSARLRFGLIRIHAALSPFPLGISASPLVAVISVYSLGFEGPASCSVRHRAGGAVSALSPEEIKRYSRHIVLRGWAEMGSRSSSQRACWLWAPAGSAARSSPILQRRGSARWASSTTTLCRSRTCSAR